MSKFCKNQTSEKCRYFCHKIENESHHFSSKLVLFMFESNVCFNIKISRETFHFSFISLNLLLNISFRIQKLPFTFPDHTQKTTHNNFGRKSILTLNYSKYILIFTSCLALLLLLIYISSLLL